MRLLRIRSRPGFDRNRDGPAAPMTASEPEVRLVLGLVPLGCAARSAVRALGAGAYVVAPQILPLSDPEKAQAI